jgi:hypothetical protein
MYTPCERYIMSLAHTHLDASLRSSDVWRARAAASRISLTLGWSVRIGNVLSRLLYMSTGYSTVRHTSHNSDMCAACGQGRLASPVYVLYSPCALNCSAVHLLSAQNALDMPYCAQLWPEPQPHQHIFADTGKSAFGIMGYIHGIKWVYTISAWYMTFC